MTVSVGGVSPAAASLVYLAVIANPGSLKSMVTGRIDENLIRVHHPESEPVSVAASAA